MDAQIESLVTQEAIRQGVPPNIALAVVQQETGGVHYSGGGVIRGGAGEVGLFQILPATASDLGVNPYDLDQNVRGGVQYLKWLYDQTGSWPDALQAYNGGIGNWQRHTVPTAAVNYSIEVLARAGESPTGVGPGTETPGGSESAFILTPWSPWGDVYDTGAVFGTTVVGEPRRTALWLLLGLGVAAAAVVAMR